MPRSNLFKRATISDVTAFYNVSAWSCGAYMPSMEDPRNLLESLARVPHKPYTPQKLYRFCWIPRESLEALQAGTKVSVKTAPGARTLQSWTTTEQEAMRFGMSRRPEGWDQDFFVAVVIGATIPTDKLVLNLQDAINWGKAMLQKGKDVDEYQLHKMEKYFEKEQEWVVKIDTIQVQELKYDVKPNEKGTRIQEWGTL